MKTRFVLCLALMSCPLLASLLPRPAHAADTPLQARLSRQLHDNRERFGIAGQALLVMHDGQRLYAGTDGMADITGHQPMTGEHAFAVYSLSKLFVSVLVMQLAEQRQLDLDAPASQWLPGLPARWQAIHVRDFLDHTSGVPEYFVNDQAPGALLTQRLPPDLATLFAELADAPMQFPTGTDTRYTQTNYVVLAALLEARLGKPYPMIVEERILHPLGLRHTWLGAVPPGQPRANAYIGKDGKLQPDPDVPWPRYALGHAGLYSTLDDLGRFLQAVAAGELVGVQALQQYWKPRTLPDGSSAWFAGGWERGQRDGYQQVGHDGGTRVRVRVVYRDRPDQDAYIFVYLTNGSARNVWSRMLVDSAMAVTAPAAFPREVVFERVLAHALRSTPTTRAQAEAVRHGVQLPDTQLERSIDTAGHAIDENLGPDPAIRAFELNTLLFPRSPAAWDSLADAVAAKGDTATAESYRATSRRLKSRAPSTGR